MTTTREMSVPEWEVDARNGIQRLAAAEVPGARILEALLASKSEDGTLEEGSVVRAHTKGAGPHTKGHSKLSSVSRLK